MPDPAHDPSNLERVGGEETALRFVHPLHIDSKSQRIMAAALKVSKRRPQSHDSGPSLYIESRLTDGAESVIGAYPRWSQHYVARAAVCRIEEQGEDLMVCFTPAECDVDELKLAHASLIGNLDRQTRDKIIGLWNRDRQSSLGVSGTGTGDEGEIGPPRPRGQEG